MREWIEKMRQRGATAAPRPGYCRRDNVVTESCPVDGVKDGECRFTGTCLLLARLRAGSRKETTAERRRRAAS